MNDDQITQSINNLAGQAGDPSASLPTPNFGLGSNPSMLQNQIQPSQDPNKDTAQSGEKNDGKNIDTTQKIDHSNEAGDPAYSAGVQPADSELESIRRDALNQLTPLLGKIEQTPEEKYRTLMMMIQASDDKSLLKSAYDAANEIVDDAKKAEALLGIVNEINYFSKKDGQNPGN